MSSITLGAPTAAPSAPARAGSTADNGGSDFGAALADAMAPERPATHAPRNTRHSTQPKADAVNDEAAPAPGADAPAADASTVDPAAPTPQVPVPTANPLALLVAGVPAAPVATDATAVPESQSAPELLAVPAPSSVPELGPASPVPNDRASDRAAVPAGTSSATVAQAAPAPATSAAAATAAVTPQPAVPAPAAKPATRAPSATPAPTSGAPLAPAADATTGPVATPVAPVSSAPLPRPAGQDSSLIHDAAPIVTQTTPQLAAQVAAGVPGSLRDESAPKSVDASVSGAAGAVAPAPASGVQAAASASPVAPAQAAPPANAPTFATQLAKPLFTLATGPAGDQIVTVKVTPENLGPVTVRAHIGAEGVRMELFAPNDAGREALRAILTDLRRDLAAQGASAGLDLSSQNQPTDSGDRGARQGASTLPDRQTSAVIEPETATVRRVLASTSSLDVLA